LIAQYLQLRAQYPEALLLMRVGDFYEAYGEGAEDLATSLNIILTTKESGKGTRVAMSGVPYHSVDSYLSRLMRQRRVVAIAEQMEQPVPNRLVRREIVRVLTPGTVLEDQFLRPDRNNYLCALSRIGGISALAAADVSTGEASVRATSNDDELAAEFERISPAEVVVADVAEAAFARSLVGDGCRIAVEASAVERGVKYAAETSVAADERETVGRALALLASFLTRLKLDGDAIAARADAARTGSAMLVDAATRRHLDLFAGSGEDPRASLLGVLSRTKTAMGSRLLAARLGAPLVDVAEIERRLDLVQALHSRVSLRLELQESLAAIGDIERIVQKIRARRAGPRDLAALRRSLDAAAALCAAAKPCEDAALARIADAAAAGGIPAKVARLLADAIEEDPPATLADGGAIRPASSEALRETVDIRANGRQRLLDHESSTRTRTGIKSLKIKYTQAVGYYFEVTRAAAESIPDDFVRRQSLANVERFTSTELKELEAAILSAKSRQIAIERDLFEALLVRVEADAAALLSSASALAQIDVYCSLAQVAGERRYVRPAILEESVIDVVAARHPVVEAFGATEFVANDCSVAASPRFLLITGPNMGGKSTYLRQTALLAILAQMGSFVPASSARLGIVDRLFTRIGAGDDIAAGRSTFYVEMEEMAVILRRCTARSLLLIDEVGRGTGTTDGLAIAQAVCEHLLALEEVMPVVLFATHFHELVGLSRAFPVIENLHVVVADEPSGPVFSHRLLQGASSRSYGIAVAEMAGLPRDVITRAKEIADEIESRPQPKAGPSRRRRDGGGSEGQLSLEV
jgi:DNA mismatch repair protein MutS